MHVKTEATVATTKTHSCYNGNSNIKKATRTSITQGWLSRSSKQELNKVQSLPTPVLQQRPQYNIFPPHKNSDQFNDEDKHTSKRATTADVLQLMDSLQLPMEEDMYVSLLKDSTLSGEIVEGAKIHAHIINRTAKKKMKKRKNIHTSHFTVNLANRLLLMYTACNSLDSARQIFNQMPVRNGSSWTTMISALSYAGEDREALGLFVDMLCFQAHGWLDLATEPTSILANLITVVLKSCFQANELGLGKQLHGVAFKMGMNATWATPLLQFYTCPVFAYCKQNQLQEAFHVFRGMFNGATRTKKDDSTAFSSILSAFARKGDERIWCGRQVHACAIKIGLDHDLYVGTSLMNMYGKYGLLDEARRAFEAVCNCRNSTKSKDSACWNAMLGNYVHNGSCVEAIRFLYEMKSAGIEPMESIVSQVMIACGS